MIDSVEVIDGDTLAGKGIIIYLVGIDAPELGQTCRNGTKRWKCGLDAANTLRGLVKWGDLTCHHRGSIETRVIASCENSAGDLSELLLRRGYAVTTDDAPLTYRRAEHAARMGKLGIWRGSFVPPNEWRNGARLEGEERSLLSVCDIKGVVDKQQRRVYYVPGDKEYESVSVNPARGERFFCSDDEAEFSGWRRYPK